jgi:tetratricopeptide (TPR) repeat protein
MATAGIAWSPLRPWTMALDFTYPFSFPGQPPAEVWNIAVGTTVAMTSFLSVQGGVLMKADNPRISLGAALTIGTLALNMNYNLDLSGSVNPLDKFSVQAKFDLGDSGRAARAFEAEALYLQGVEEFANGNYERALALWQEVLRLDPKYLPAADNIRTVQQTISLQEQTQTVKPK